MTHPNISQNIYFFRFRVFQTLILYWLHWGLDKMTISDTESVSMLWHHQAIVTLDGDTIEHNTCVLPAVEVAEFMMTSSNGNIFVRYWPFVRGIHRSPAQRPVTRSFDVFFDLRLNKRLSKQPWGWWFETLLWSLCCNCNVIVAITDKETRKLFAPVLVPWIIDKQDTYS